MQAAQNDSGFDQIISHNLNPTFAPTKITLPKELVEGLQNAWDNSFPNGKSQEQGGILVRHQDQSYEWKAGKGSESSSFRINYEDVNKDETLALTGHTHPYDDSEGGYTDVSFSGTDLANFVYGKEATKVVQSGKALFLVASAIQFNRRLKNLDAKGKRKLYTEINRTWLAIFSTHQGSDLECVEAAVKTTCRTYNFVYYKGQGNLLKKVDISDQNDLESQQISDSAP